MLYRQKRLADSQFRWLLETGEDFMVPSQLDMQDDTEEVITWPQLSLHSNRWESWDNYIRFLPKKKPPWHYPQGLAAVISLVTAAPLKGPTVSVPSHFGIKYPPHESWCNHSTHIKSMTTTEWHSNLEGPGLRSLCIFSQACLLHLRVLWPESSQGKADIWVLKRGREKQGQEKWWRVVGR